MYQKIIIIGNLGRDPEIRYLPNSGAAVTNFSVATNRTYTNANGERIQETVWFRVSAWGKLAETTNQYLRKGSKVLVEGRMVADPQTGGPRIWTRQDGTPAASFEIHAMTVRFLSTREETEAAAQNMGNAAPVDDLPAAEDEIPF